MALIEITGRRMDGEDRHENVVEVRAVTAAGDEMYATPAEVIRWLEKNTNVALVYTADRTRRFIVGVYRGQSGERMLRTHVQTTWSDHLLALPEFADAERPNTALPGRPRAAQTDELVNR